MSENGIETIENLDKNTKLETLDLALNRVAKIENLNHLQELEELWVNSTVINLINKFKKFYLFVYVQLNDNQVTDWKCIENLMVNKKLATIYLERNEIAKDVQYRKKIMLTLPWLTKIDATLSK